MKFFMTIQTTSDNILTLFPAHSLKQDLSLCSVFKLGNWKKII